VCQEPHWFRLDPGWLDALEGVATDQLITDGGRQDTVEASVRLSDGPGGYRLATRPSLADRSDSHARNIDGVSLDSS
jgi:hypothetical protein